MKGALAFVRDLLGIGAVGSIAYGAWMIYAPAGFIVGGMLVLVGVFLLERGEQR
jgi:hypothetical protein